MNPAEFKEPVVAPTNRTARVTVRDVAAATKRAGVVAAARTEHAEAMSGFVSENPNASHFYTQLDPRDMIVDPRIQRAENPGEINAIVRDYNSAALGTWTISRRIYPATATESERIELVVVDGQQRRAATLLVGYEGLVHCDVHDGLTLADEAKLFRQLNFRRSVSQITLFQTALVEGNPHALAVQAILDSLQIKFGTVRGYMAAKGSQSLVKRNNGIANLHWALAQTKRLWDRGNGGVYDGPLVEALFRLHERHGGRIDEARLYDKLASDEGSNSGLLEFAKTMKRAHKCTTPVSVILAIIDRYNSGLGMKSRNRLPEWGATEVSE